jgi:hypothetical protein
MSVPDINAYMAANDPKDQALSLLPALGATAAVATGPPGLLAATLLAGAGGMGGRLIENLVRKNTGGPGGPQTEMERFTDPLIEGGKMAGLEAIGGPVLSRILSPGAKSMEDPAARRFMDYATKNDLPMMPSTIAPAPLLSSTTAVEGLSRFFPTGRFFIERSHEQLYQKMLDSRAKMLGDLTGTTAEMSQSPVFADAISSTSKMLKDKTIGAYAEIVPGAGGKSARIPMSNTREFIDQMMETPRVQRNEKLVKLLDDFNTESATGLTAKDFERFQQKVNKTTAINKDYNLGKAIWENINKDLAAFDEATGKQLLDVVTTARGSNAQMAKFVEMQKLFKKATSIKDGQELFNADRFYFLVNNDQNRNYMVKQFGEDAFANMKEYAEYMRKISMDISKTKLGEMGKIWQTVLAGGGAASSFYAPGVLVPYGASAVAAWRMMAPKSTFKKWLTTGMGPEGKEAIKIGGRAAISGGDD